MNRYLTTAFGAALILAGCSGPTAPDTTVPTITISTPADDTIVANAAGELTVTGTVTDTGGNLLADSVTVFAGGQEATATLDLDNNAWTATFTGFSEGTVHLSASVEDDAGFRDNAGPFRITFDTTAPTVNIIAPPDGATLSIPDDETTGGSLDFTAIVSVDDLGAGAVGETMSLLDDLDNLICSGTVNDAGATLSGCNLADGVHILRAEVDDLAGFTGTSAALNLTIDNTAPTLVLAMSDTDYNANEDPIISLTSDVPDGTMAQTYINGAPFALVMITGGVGAVSAMGSLAEGTNTMHADVLDPAGNPTTSNSETVTFDSAVSVTIQSPQDNDVYSTNPLQVIASTDPDAVNAELFIDMVSQGSVAPTGNVAQFSVSPVEGLRQVQVTVTDASGNVSTDSVNVRLDATAPTITFDDYADLDVVKQAEDTDGASVLNQVAIAATIDDSGVTISNYDVRYFINGRNEVSSTANAQNQSEILTLRDGSNEITIQVTDAAGNVGSRTLRLYSLLAATRSLTGTFETPAGAGIAGATVQLSASLDFNTIVATATTGAGGLFTLNDVPLGRYAGLRVCDEQGGDPADPCEPDFDRMGFLDLGPGSGPGGGQIVVSSSMLSPIPVGPPIAGIQMGGPLPGCTITGDLINAGLWDGVVLDLWVASVGGGAIRSWDMVPVPAVGNASYVLNEFDGANVSLLVGADIDRDGKPSVLDDPFSFTAGGTTCINPGPTGVDRVIAPPRTVSGSVSGNSTRGLTVMSLDPFGGFVSTRRVESDGTFSIRQFAAPNQFVVAFLDLDANLVTGFNGDDTEPLANYTASVNTINSDQTGVNIGFPDLRLVTGLVNNVPDFRVGALPTGFGGEGFSTYQEGNSGRYGLQVFPDEYDVGAFDDTDVDGRLDDLNEDGFSDRFDEYLEPGGVVDVRTGDAGGPTIGVQPNIVVQDVITIDGVDGILHPLELVTFDVVLRNRGAPSGGVMVGLEVGDGDPPAGVPSVNVDFGTFGVGEVKNRQFAGIDYSGTAHNIGDFSDIGLDYDQDNNPDDDFSKIMGGVLVVDDDSALGGPGDVTNDFNNAATRSTHDFDFMLFADVPAGNPGPTALLMQGFGATFWYTGDNVDTGGGETLLAVDKTQIQSYLDIPAAPQANFALFSPGYVHQFAPGPGPLPEMFTLNYIGVFAVDGFDVGDSDSRLNGAGLANGLKLDRGQGNADDALTCTLQDTLFTEQADPVACENIDAGVGGLGHVTFYTTPLRVFDRPALAEIIERNVELFRP